MATMNPHTKNQILAHLAEARRLLAPHIDLDGPISYAESADTYVRYAEDEAQSL